MLRWVRAPREPSETLDRRALRVAAEAGRQAGVDVLDARVLRVRSSVHVELPRAGVVARVEAPGNEELAHTQVWAARLLADRGAPVARLFRHELQPILLGDAAVTLWRRLRSVHALRLEALGRSVRALHEATRDALPPDSIALDPFVRIRSDLDLSTSWSGSKESEALLRRLEALEAEWPSATREDPLGTVLVHGDVHADNAMVTEDGLVLIDLEDAGIGPASWDFVPQAVGARRYGLPPERYREFVGGYGSEPGDWPGLDLMCQVYEFLVTAWAMRCSADSPRLAAEASIRVEGLLNGGERLWTLL